jgi:hypothetical protein
MSGCLLTIATVNSKMSNVKDCDVESQDEEITVSDTIKKYLMSIAKNYLIAIAKILQLKIVRNLYPTTVLKNYLSLKDNFNVSQ